MFNRRSFLGRGIAAIAAFFGLSKAGAGERQFSDVELADHKWIDEQLAKKDYFIEHASVSGGMAVFSDRDTAELAKQSRKHSSGIDCGFIFSDVKIDEWRYAHQRSEVRGVFRDVVAPTTLMQDIFKPYSDVTQAYKNTLSLGLLDVQNKLIMLCDGTLTPQQMWEDSKLIAKHLLALPEKDKYAFLCELKTENPAMHSCVKHQLDITRDIAKGIPTSNHGERADYNLWIRMENVIFTDANIFLTTGDMTIIHELGFVSTGYRFYDAKEDYAESLFRGHRLLNSTINVRPAKRNLRVWDSRVQQYVEL